jgi:tRNA-splicing ligase RtcB (3'-phosphate/5'-hydroxy nucleic acid ligase)
MEWVKKEENYRVPIKSWCAEVDAQAIDQAANLACHPVIFHHVALMPDCHVGYGMPIGGVIAGRDAVIPNAVGVDIGCGMGAVRTSLAASDVSRQQLRDVVTLVKEMVPCGEGQAHKQAPEWDLLEEHLAGCLDRGWFSDHVKDLARRNLGTLGGGNHFIEIQAGDDGRVWLMIHSGSRHLGNVIARFHHQVAQSLNQRWHAQLPSDDLAFLPTKTDEGQQYIEDMNLALNYAKENRRRILERFMVAVTDTFVDVSFETPVNIHHNYAALENHFGVNVWVHRKGATAAREGEAGIIPGSMGTPSYIVEGLGNQDAFMSCSHGAGRVMGRKEASRKLTPESCDQAMEGVVYDRWNKIRRGKDKGMFDLGEAPQAYKDIDTVIQAELDLIRTVVKLRPLAVVKG